MIKMKFESLESDLTLLYIEAKEHFKKCIRDKENKFLQDEVNILLDDIVIIEKDIKIIFTQKNFTEYICEVSLLLFEGSREIGRYLYIQNEKQEEIDDSLVFY